MPKKKILLIDDEEDLCALVKFNLEGSGRYEVTTAHSGEEGLKKAKEADFDLVITDFKMSGMDGKAVLKALKEMNPSLPVALFSIYHDDKDTISDLDLAKADGLITKPFESEQLDQIIQDILNKAGK